MNHDKYVAQRRAIHAEADLIVKRAEAEQRALSGTEREAFDDLMASLQTLDDSMRSTLASDEARAGLSHILGGSSRVDEAQYRYGAFLARYIRPDLYESRAPVTITSVGGAGNAPVGNDYKTEWVELVSEQDALLRNAAFTWMTTDAVRVQVPLVNADAVAGATSGEADDLTDGTFSGLDAAALTITPVKYGSWERLSAEVVNDATPRVLDAFSRSVLRKHALAWQANIVDACEASGTAVAGDSGHKASFDALSDAISDIEAAGGDPARVVIVAPPATVKGWRVIKEAAGSTVPTLLGGNGGITESHALNLFGARIYSSTAVGANNAVVMDPAHVIAVVRDQPNIKVSEDFYFGSDEYAFRALSRFQAAVVTTNAAAVRVLTDAP